MKAVQIKSFGGPEVLEVTENTQIPNPGENQIMVEVHAASINRFDLYVLNSGAGAKPPLILGGDFAGVVKEVSDQTSNFIVGDEVYGQALVQNGGSGSFAEVAVSNVKNTALKPKDINFEEAASLPLVGASAIQALEDGIKLTAGQKILIHGGAGGIGSIAIQLAKAIGAYVITTVSADDIDFVKSLGADEIIDYKKQKFEEKVKDVDGVFDTVGGETTNKSFTVLKKGGVLVSMVGISDPSLAEKYDVTAIPQFTQTNTDRLNRLRKYIEQGKVKPQIDKTFQLEQIRDAFDYMINASPRGKVVIKIK